MENCNSNDILLSLRLLCEERDYDKYFSKYLKLEVKNELLYTLKFINNSIYLQELTKELEEELINTLAHLLFDPRCTNDVFKYFSKYTLQYLSTIIPLDKGKINLDYTNHVKNCIVLSILGFKHPDAYR